MAWPISILTPDITENYGVGMGGLFQQPSKTTSTATPPVSGGPVETPGKSDSDTGGDTTASTITPVGPTGWEALSPLIEKLGLNKDYLAEAAKMVPEPPQYPGIQGREGWAAIGIPALVAGLTGGPMGLAAMGQAVGEAGLANVQARQMNWQNLMQRAQAVGGLANMMQQRGLQMFGAIAPYVAMRQAEAYGLRIKLEEAQRRAWDTYRKHEEAQKRLDILAQHYANVDEIQRYRAEIQAANEKSLESYRQANEALRAGQLELAQQKFQEYTQYQWQSLALRARQLQLLAERIANEKDIQTRRNRIQELRIAESELVNLRSILASDPTANPAMVAAIDNSLNSVNAIIEQETGMVPGSLDLSRTQSTTGGTQGTGAGTTTGYPYGGPTIIYNIGPGSVPAPSGQPAPQGGGGGRIQQTSITGPDGKKYTIRVSTDRNDLGKMPVLVTNVTVGGKTYKAVILVPATMIGGQMIQPVIDPSTGKMIGTW